MPRARSSRSRIGRRAFFAAAGLAASACAFGVGAKPATDPAGDETATDDDLAIAEAHAASGSDATPGSGSTTTALDLPLRPEIVGALRLDGLAVQLAYRDPHVFVAAQGSGIHIVDVLRDDQPLLVGTLGSAADFVAIDGDVMLGLTVGVKQPLAAWNVAIPSLPREIPVPPSVGATKFSSVSIDGPLAVVSGGSSPMSVLDTSDPEAVRLHATISKPINYASVRLRGSRAYVSTEVAGDGRYGVGVYDLSEPARPSLVRMVRVPNGGGISRVRSPGHFDVSVDAIGEFMYVTGAGELAVVDLSDIERPRYLETVPAPPDVVWVERGDDLLLVAGGDVDVVDITDPSKPAPQFRIATPGQARAAIRVRDRIYVADGEAGLTTVRI